MMKSEKRAENEALVKVNADQGIGSSAFKFRPIAVRDRVDSRVPRFLFSRGQLFDHRRFGEVSQRILAYPARRRLC